MSNKTDHQEVRNENTCSAIAVHHANVSVPIQFHPFAIVGHVETECVEDPEIIICEDRKNPCCHGNKLIITQTLRITIPIENGATANIGCTSVNCKGKQQREHVASEQRRKNQWSKYFCS